MTPFIAARLAARSLVRSSSSSVNRIVITPRIATFTSSVRVLAGSGPPVIQGEGAKPGEVATDENQATGLERLELLGRLEGVDVFDMQPLESDRRGTKKDPIMIKSLVSTSKEERKTMRLGQRVDLPHFSIFRRSYC